MRPLGLTISLALLLLSVIRWPANSQSVFERMIMPGDLIDGHVKLEPKCENCHDAFSKSAQSQLCRDCHQDVANDISRRQGFHGRDQGASSSECKFCHTDHEGRDADIVKLDPEIFDHALTDFSLLGRHRSAACEGCHKTPKKMRDAPALCVGCHKEDDRHRGELGDGCQDCHSEDGWARTKPFDHGKTDFPLVGAHVEVACSICHRGERYKDLATDCVSCHRTEDVHEGRNGPKCERCHSPEKWKLVKFNHDRDTHFPLRGQHAKAKCESCHSSNAFEAKLATTCVSCHRGDDAHAGQLGNDCGQCHQENGWRRDLSFNHDITRFPLLGLHAAASCEACHTTAQFREAPRACVGCHKKNDTHEGRLGANCAFCHTPNGWAFWTFDHDSQTAYPLTGAHAGLDCLACHKESVSGEIKLSSRCYNCHRNDDVHRGTFGRRCERCHTTQSFVGVRAQ